MKYLNNIKSFTQFNVFKFHQTELFHSLACVASTASHEYFIIAILKMFLLKFAVLCLCNLTLVSCCQSHWGKKEVQFKTEPSTNIEKIVIESEKSSTDTVKETFEVDTPEDGGSGDFSSADQDGMYETTSHVSLVTLYTEDGLSSVEFLEELEKNEQSSIEVPAVENSGSNSAKAETFSDDEDHFAGFDSSAAL